jgi:pimeloyl-ACP methyl ester carboxylesterase
MIRVAEIGGRKLACWTNNGSFLPGLRTLVFIHGSGGSHQDWVQQYTPLKHAFNIVAIDLPGHGQSDGPGEQDVPAYVAWIKRLLDGLGIVKPVLIGHSLGAAICLSFAIRHGDAAAAVVPVGGGTRMNVNPAILEGLKRTPTALIGMTAKFSIAKGNRERLADIVTENLLRANPEVFYGDFLACSKLDITDAIVELRIPTLVICGDEDKMTPPALSEYLGGHIPGARLALIPEAGHMVMLEKPEAFNASLTEFLNSLTSPPPAGGVKGD